MSDLPKNLTPILLAVLCVAVILMSVFDAPDIAPVGIVYTESSQTDGSIGTAAVTEMPASETKNTVQPAGTAKPAATKAASTSGTAKTVAVPLIVNINTAGTQELITLNGVGEVIAQRIIDYREANGAFLTIEDIKKVKGIGDVTFEKIKPYITV